MIKFLQENIKYPELAVKENRQGKVFIEIIVEKNGAISQVNLIRGVGFGLDEEALRVIFLMPKWVSGKYKDKPVRVKMNIPISFSITEK
jgi:protein TonB